jgi:peptidoglycan-associated lipoprotein
MKLNRFTHLLALGALLTLAVSGCVKRPGPQDYIYGNRFGNLDVADNSNNGNNNGNGGHLAQPGGVGSTNVTSTQEYPLANPDDYERYNRNADVFKAYTVHFAFDMSAIRAADKPNIASVAAHLQANPAQAVEVQGHCDERGTAEYNRSLGERRALAIREELIRLGIAPKRVVTKSFGFDQPEDPARNDAAYAKNRRGVFILLTPPAPGAPAAATGL